MRPAPGGFGDKKRKKVYIPVDQYPDINFMGELAFFLRQMSCMDASEAHMQCHVLLPVDQAC